MADKIKNDIDSSKNPEDLALTRADTIGFFSHCKLLIRHSYQGALQVANAPTDSSSYLCFADCYTCPKNFEVIFVYKGGIQARKTLGYDTLGNLFKNGCNDTFSHFDCFAFVIPMRDPEKQDDIHAMNIIFPAKTSIYKRIEGDKWHFIGSKYVHNFNEYVNLQFRTIYFN